MNTKYKYISILFLLLVFPSIILGQKPIEVDLPKYIPSSPSATSMAKYVNYPVEYSNGLVNIEIPLYEIKAGSITLPISLNYHASGLKVSELGGWVGSGWTLNADPGISRSVEGLPDEKSFLKQNKYDLNNSSKKKEYYSYLLSGSEDESSDIYYYKTLNKSGKFIIKRDRKTSDGTIEKFYIHPRAQVNISFDYNKDYSVFNSWKIIDDDGLVYTFDGSEIVDRTINNTSLDNYITKFKCTKIKSNMRENDSINFIYWNHQYDNMTTYSDIMVLEDFVNSGNSFFNNPYSDCNGITLPLISMNELHYGLINRDGSLEMSRYFFNDCRKKPPIIPNKPNYYKVSERNLKHIEFPGGKIEFKLVDDLSKNLLDSIRIYISNEVIRTIKFEYKSTNNKRDFLSAVKIYGQRGVGTPECHTFDYYSPDDFPSQDSKKMDYWGYYNGYSTNDEGNKSFIPSQTIETSKGNFYFIGSYRDATGNVSGMLSQINYPSGAYTKFTYKPNVYSPGGSGAIIVGGLRIYKILSGDYTTGKKTEREFHYGVLQDPIYAPAAEIMEAEAEDGWLKRGLDMKNFMYRQSRYHDDVILETALYTYYSNSISNLFLANGCPVSYEYVSEYKRDPVSTKFLSRTEYRYNVEYEDWSRDISIPSDIDQFRGWADNYLISKKEFIRENNRWKLLQKQEYKYTTIDSYIEAGKKVYEPIIRDVTNIMENPYSYYNSHFPTGYIRKDSEKTTTYTALSYERDSIVQKSTYSYDLFERLREKNTWMIDGNNEVDKEIDRYWYANDNIVGYSYYLRELGNTSELTQYEHEKGGINQITRKNYTLSKYNGIPVLSDISTNTSSNGGFEQRVQYGEYDRYGNPQEVSLSNGTKITYLWSYGGRYPLAEIKNASYKETISQISNDSNVIKNLTIYADTSKVNILREKLPQSEVTTFIYNAYFGVVSSITDPRGVETRYIYDNFGRLVKIEDKDENIIETYRYNFNKKNK